MTGQETPRPEYAVLAPGAALPPGDARVASLYHYWLALRPCPGLLPARRHFSPFDVPSLLQWLWLTDVQRSPLRFKYRLIGTRHVEAEGADRTGRWYDEVHPRFEASTAFPHFVAVAEQRRVAFYRGPPVYVIDARWKTIERLILPLAEDGREVDMLLGITVLDPVASDTPL
jgi:hypothetical protein